MKPRQACLVVLSCLVVGPLPTSLAQDAPASKSSRENRV